jgi:hypothetical protein
MLLRLSTLMLCFSFPEIISLPAIGGSWSRTSIGEYVHWHNEVKPHMSLNFEALETPIHAFHRKQPPKEEKTETAEPLVK